jgi:hypothetical protein
MAYAREASPEGMANVRYLGVRSGGSCGNNTRWRQPAMAPDRNRRHAVKEATRFQSRPASWPAEFDLRETRGKRQTTSSWGHND